eukprot:412029-Prorocentrum_minimum.AAC.1
MATWLSEFSPRLLKPRAASVFPSASPVRSSCTSGSTAPAPTMATRLSEFTAKLLSAHAA